ncbi:hypothetical protein KOI35_26115 [Actinoplanes bogorensis]|uniref:ABC transporter substrate-binding protein n=1 Tax=Paractinoplanes bogorensis TaxID=1610840 RepID=A0ABS5YU61_9ACTN|nr:hypothetical protein [Actinoplanes bogorensis]MBU2666992.1 hypothetical protein [Actinoplanes bogorensis]
MTCDLFKVHGLVGSEKLSFFADPDVRAAFARHGLDVTVESAGSRTMACDSDLAAYDFAFPGSEPAAAGVLAKQGVVAAPIPVFSSPLVVATYRDVARALPAGVVSPDLRTFDVERYLDDVFTAGKRWGDLRLAPPYPTFQRAVLLSTRLDTSNSAELLLALTSYAANGDRPIASPDPGAVTDRMESLFRAQGSTGLTSEEPFDQYFSAEGYQLPLQVVYEAQFLDAVRQDPAGLVSRVTAVDGTKVTLERIMLYPLRSVSSTHAIAALKPRGTEVATVLTGDPELRRLAARHGFRPAGDAAVFADENADRGAAVDLPGPPVPVPPQALWNSFLDTVVAGVYGKDRAGATCA